MASLIYGKVPPQAKELEEAVLGAIMLERGAFEVASEIIGPDSFYIEAHRKIFKAMMLLAASSRPIDLLTVVEVLRKNGELEEVGGPYAVTKLTNAVATSAHLETHAKIIQERFLSREMIRLGGELVQKGFDDTEDAFSTLEFAESSLFGLATGNLKQNYVSTQELSVDAIRQIDHLMANPQDISGVPTGYKALDNVTRGFQPTDLIIIAARPSVGKTAFALNLAMNAAMNTIRPTAVGVFSMEMSAGQLMHRMISAQSEVSLEKILRGRLQQHEYEKVHAASATLFDAPIFVDDTPGLNAFELRAKARRMVTREKVGLIIVDYLQLMSGLDKGKSSNREQEISTISRSLKGLAKELKIPVIALSQLSRKVEDRKGNEPQLSDLRESGAIEQDADVVMFLTRPDYQQQSEKVDPSIRNDAEVKIKKHRQGKLEDVLFKTNLAIQRWYDLDDYPGDMANSWHSTPSQSITQQPESHGDDLPF